MLCFVLPLAVQQGLSQLASPCRQPRSFILDHTCFKGMCCALESHVLPGLATSGTRDFLPEDLRVRQWLFGEFEAVARLFGFEQFETPVLESEALFTRKAGDEITQQLYNFEARCALSHHRSSASVRLHGTLSRKGNEKPTVYNSTAERAEQAPELCCFCLQTCCQPFALFRTLHWRLANSCISTCCTCCACDQPHVS